MPAIVYAFLIFLALALCIFLLIAFFFFDDSFWGGPSK